MLGAIGRLEGVDIKHIEGLGERLVVVVEPHLTQARILFERVVVLDPLPGGLDASVVFGEAGMDETFEAA